MFQTIIILSDTIEIDKITQNLVEFFFDKKETIEQPKQDYLRGRCIEYFTKNEEILTLLLFFNPNINSSNKSSIKLLQIFLEKPRFLCKEFVKDSLVKFFFNID